jgi:hypothetical protein
MSRKSTVVYLHQLDPQAALERLNRVTGLRFSSWPQSLAPLQEPVLVAAGLTDECAAVAEPLSYVAQDACV